MEIFLPGPNIYPGVQIFRYIWTGGTKNGGSVTVPVAENGSLARMLLFAMFTMKTTKGLLVKIKIYYHAVYFKRPSHRPGPSTPKLKKKRSLLHATSTSTKLSLLADVNISHISDRDQNVSGTYTAVQ